MLSALLSREMIERLRGGPVVPGQTDFWQKAMDEIGPVEGMVRDVKELARQRLSDISLKDASA